MPRVIHTLRFDLEPDVPGQTVHLFAHLDAAGQSPFCQAVPPKQRVIDLREGDWIRHGGKVRRIVGIKAHDEGTVGDGETVERGYVVRQAMSDQLRATGHPERAS